jgi:hypothetical protein
MRYPWIGWASVAGGLAIAAVACGTQDPINLTVRESPDGESPDSGPPRQFSDATVEDASGYQYACSEDLHQVLNAKGQVVMTCPDDQGCDPERGCVRACDAANANHSSVGCEYYAVQPDGVFAYGACYALYVINTWTTPVHLGLELGARSFDITPFARIPVGSGASLKYEPLPDGVLPPGQIALLFPSGVNFRCGDLEDPPPIARPNVLGTAMGDAFHLTADRPVVALDLYDYSSLGLSTGTLLQPTSAWGTNYVGVDPYPPSVAAAAPAGPLTLQIVARDDDTTVTIVPSHDIDDGYDMKGAPKNIPVTYSLDPGEVLQLASSEGVAGSVIQANKPIGVWATSSLTLIPEGVAPGDSTHQQLPSVPTLGNEYVAVRHANRVIGGVDGVDESPPWRMMGIVDGTTLTYDPAPPPGAPTTIDAGEVKQFSTSTAFSVTTQDKEHPLYLSGHMTSVATLTDQQGQSPDDQPGDPEFVNIVPPSQFLKSYTFFAGPNFPNSSLVLVRPKADDGTFKDVILDCAGPLTGWTPVGTGGKYEYTRIDLARKSQPQNGCDSGAHTIKSEAPFGVTVWGWGWCSSYAIPAGVRSVPVNAVVVPPVPR